MKNQKLTAKFRVAPGERVWLRDHDPAWAGEKRTKAQALELLKKNLVRLSAAQELLWASERYALMIVFQAMDTAGKDGLIQHVMTGLNPQGCYVVPFKQPSVEELSHDFLWRYSKSAPALGRIGIFNRSHYEEVLVLRVHPELLLKEHVETPKPLAKLWRQRYDEINAYEQHLARNRTVILKFFLNLSKKEQKKRLMARLSDPSKYWKFSINDLSEREYWDDYVHAYQDALSATSTDYAPWYIVPADHKWVTRWLVSEIIAQTIDGLDLAVPKLTKEQVQALARARQILKRE